MKKDTTNTPAYVTDGKLFDNWFDPIETELRMHQAAMRGRRMSAIEGNLEEKCSCLLVLSLTDAVEKGLRNGLNDDSC